MTHSALRDAQSRQHQIKQPRTTASPGQASSEQFSAQPTNKPQHSLMRLPQVQQRTGLGRTSIYQLIKTASFPAPVKVGHASLWVEAEISAWINELVCLREVV